MVEPPVRVGVIGVGTMGNHHARVYNELGEANLVGIHDTNPERAEEIATEYGTDVASLEDLTENTDAVSVAVPTQYHYEVVKECLEAGLAVLVEKPLVADLDRGAELVSLADEQDVPLQVGHIERFNPAVETLAEILPQLDVVAIEARRLGPDPGREIQDTVVTDLMIHDIDIVTWLVGADVKSAQATGTADGRYANATLAFDDDTVASLTASRMTQQKVRELTITAVDRYVTLDYLQQNLEFHRQSVPEFVTEDGDVRYRHESVIERPVVRNVEPLKNELESFLEVVTNGSEPVVSGADGLRVIEMVQTINQQAFDENVRNHETVR